MAVKSLHRVLAVGFLLCVVCVAQIKADLRITFVEDLCQLIEPDSVTLTLTDESGILKSVERVFSSIGYMNCQIKMVPKYGRSIVLGINQYHTYPGDELSLRDTDGFEISLIGYGLFPDEKKSFISNGPINIHFIRNNTGYKLPRGFQMTYTQVKNAPCYSDQFQCKNDFCISSDLVCDGHNHCGDRSDQTKCVIKESKVVAVKEEINVSPIWIVSISLCAAVLLIVIIGFIVVFAIRRKQQKSATTPQPSNPNKVVHPPPSAPPQAAEHTFQPGEDGSGDVRNDSFFTRVRRSLRGMRSQTKVEQPMEELPRVYQVPNMYPSLESVATAAARDGVDNPEFNSDE